MFLSNHIGGMLLVSNISMAFAGLVITTMFSRTQKLWMAEDRLLVIPSLRNILLSLFFAVLIQTVSNILRDLYTEFTSA
jgi:hypothetical protein